MMNENGNTTKKKHSQSPDKSDYQLKSLVIISIHVLFMLSSIMLIYGPRLFRKRYRVICILISNDVMDDD